MNAYEDNPFFFFVDNPTFPVDVYPDIGKIIELSDTGCDARTTSTSNRRRNYQNRPYSAKTLYTDVLSFQDAFDEKEKHKDNQFNERIDKKSKKVPARDRTVPRNSRRSRTIERDNNEKVDRCERNVADLKNTLLRDQVNLLDDSSIENILDRDPISGNSGTYFSKNSLPRREIDRKSRNEERNVRNEKREGIPDFAKNSNEMRSTPSVSQEETSKGKRIASASRSTRVDRKKRRENFEKNNNERRNEGTKDFAEKSRRSVDRAVDKDSLSDNSGISDNIETNANENRKSLPKEERSLLGQRSKGLANKTIKNCVSLEEKKNSSVEKRRSRILSNGNIEVDKDDTPTRKYLNARHHLSQDITNDRAKSYARTISKSADFDKAKHRANMAKRYANKTWMKTRRNMSTSEKMGENEIFDNSNEKNFDHVQRNDGSRKKAVSKSAGSSIRKRDDAQSEKAESEEAGMIFDDNGDQSKRTTRIPEERSSTNRARTTAVPASRSFRREDNDNSRSSDGRSTTQGGIQRKDLEKLSAIFLSSALKRNSKQSVSKLNNRNERESRKERNKSVPTTRNRIEKTGLDRISSSHIPNETNSKIRLSISNLSKLPNKTEKWVKSKIPVAISRLKKELEESRIPDNNDFGEFPLRGSSSRTKSTMKENEPVSNSERIDESTSIGIITIDKSDFSKNENNEIRSRLDEWSKKLEETRRKERDVELKVLKMAKAQKEERKKEFEKRGFREPVKKARNEGKKDIVDIAATMYERESAGKRSYCTSNYNDDRDVIDGSHVEPDLKPYSLRSSMYARYFSTAR